jgi:hypothetical protein
LVHSSYSRLLDFLARNVKDLVVICQILLNKTIKISDRSFSNDKLLLEEFEKDLITIR